MSSCWTLRLNRRKAFSRGSPSCTRTSPKPIHPPTYLVGFVEFFSSQGASQALSYKRECILVPPLSYFETFRHSRGGQMVVVSLAKVSGNHNQNQNPPPFARIDAGDTEKIKTF